MTNVEDAAAEDQPYIVYYSDSESSGGGGRKYCRTMGEARAWARAFVQESFRDQARARIERRTDGRDVAAWRNVGGQARPVSMLGE